MKAPCALSSWRYDNPKFQKLVTKAMTGPANEVNDTMKQAARILNDDVSGGFLYLMPKTTVTRAGIAGQLCAGWRHRCFDAGL